MIIDNGRVVDFYFPVEIYRNYLGTTRELMRFGWSMEKQGCYRSPRVWPALSKSLGIFGPLAMMQQGCEVKIATHPGPRISEGVHEYILALHNEGRHPQGMIDLAGCSLHTINYILRQLKASKNGLSVTFQILFKQDQICFERYVVQGIMQTTVNQVLTNAGEAQSIEHTYTLRRHLVMSTGNPRVFSHLPLPLPDANPYPFHG
ncbi:uncharacterized protein LACBIDRAFT_331383 [Laccaria bicolor S238N-H82]|uniref:Predicted protein n=1 Tax=Laccaria bicolor (strain S238N-H82 / ATCC MYA-4686) TaxID=486041 RepID=B0DPB5_LACBS|nr:uncharacterized protein LACBIDRAFT_331383 [Laccaria bicolor S238N-H82]EDR03588.1 predicted protein [Laccaria bicolor S238N-H82]|eukprot:XP_001885736.1 predicted protein [Laccaria bicolor S238N-H82]